MLLDAQILAAQCDSGTAPVVIRSVYDRQDDILRAITELHCNDGFQCDVTFGNGAFWRNAPAPEFCFDLEPQRPWVVKANFANLPLQDGQLRNLVADPPFLTYVKNGRGHQNGTVAMTARFGGYYTYGELEESYRGLVMEASRVLRPLGRLVFKCQDIIHNHKMHCTHSRVIALAEQAGFRLLDLFILTARHRMPGPQKGKQRHARIFHSYFLVFERGRK